MPRRHRVPPPQNMNPDRQKNVRDPAEHPLRENADRQEQPDSQLIRPAHGGLQAAQHGAADLLKCRERGVGGRHEEANP